MTKIKENTTKPNKKKRSTKTANIFIADNIYPSIISLRESDFDYKEYNKVFKKVDKDCNIVNARVESWVKYLYNKLISYDDPKIVGKIKLFMARLQELQKGYHLLLIQAKSVTTNTGTSEVIVELKNHKTKKNKLYCQCKSINHLQGLMDLTIKKII